MTNATKQQLEKEYNALTISIRGYINDSKLFGFEPTELPKMQAKAAELMRKISKM